MIPRIVLAAGLTLSLLPITPPVSATTLYTWRNADGSLTFTDDPRGAPPDVQIRIWADVDVASASPESPVPAPESIPPIPAKIPEGASQGAFAARLVGELGLRERSDAGEATDLLSRYRIAPRLGRWELDQPLDPELTIRLRRLTVASAAEGWIDITPDEALLAFDTTAAFLGVAIPLTDLEGSADDSPSTIADMPPLVYPATPPPELYPYYTWQPWTDGYWWNGMFFSGVYILDIDQYAGHHHRHHHHEHRGNFRDHHQGDDHVNTMTPDRIGHHLRDRVAHDTATATLPPPRRIHRSAGAAAPIPRHPARLIDSGAPAGEHMVHRRSTPSQITKRHQTVDTHRQGHPVVRLNAPNLSASERPAVSSRADGRHGRGFSRD